MLHKRGDREDLKIYCPICLLRAKGGALGVGRMYLIHLSTLLLEDEFLVESVHAPLSLIGG